MRGGGKPKRKSTTAVPVPEGLHIEDDERFYKDIRTALAAALGFDRLVQATRQIGQRKLVYVRDPNSPTIQGREGALPVLPLLIDTRQSAWLVVEIESKYGNPLVLKHVSLKFWQGATIDDAHLCFRAEWDMRGSKSDHAQPHWNVHAPRGLTSELASEVDFEAFANLEQAGEIASFAEFEKVEAAGAVQLTPNPTHGLSVEQMHEFHFAMASNWHLSNGATGPTIRTTQEVVTWIAACSLYIKHQFSFVLGT